MLGGYGFNATMSASHAAKKTRKLMGEQHIFILILSGL